jgi:hypothetical protein
MDQRERTTSSVMAGLDPASQCAHVRARVKRRAASKSVEVNPHGAQTRADWVAGSSPAMTAICAGARQ